MRAKLLVGLLSLAFLASCGDAAKPSEDASIKFPTSSTFTLRYADFLDTTGTGRNYDSIGVVEERIVGSRQVAGRTAFLHENRLVASGGTSIDTTLHAYENGNRDQWIYLAGIEDLVGNLGNFNLQGFSPGWYPYLKTSAEIGRNYAILAPTQLTLRLTDTLVINATVRAVGNVRGKETITVQGRRYETTKLVLTFSLSARLGGIALPDAEILQHVWCANNIGVVKFETTSATIGIPPFFAFRTPNSKQELINVVGTPN
ncbi:MAG: hypothetical protein NZM06_09675 [Chloroherpetonaceae bacterium]|nr:hypothetical protein [Chloroherpetonaceae bacterium]MDW8438048.1 hypothetical protein [Chloroherpetonaceae bacterium]